MIITISGKSCSGKSLIAEYLCGLIKNSKHLAIDKIGHQVIEEEGAKARICEAFGILPENYSRKAIAQVVFNDKSKMDVLTEITWGRMQEIIDEFIEQNKGKTIVLDWALMPKSKYFEQADANILVDVPLEQRLERAMTRDGISREKFLERESASLDYSNTKFDFVISNLDFEEAKREVYNVFKNQIEPSALEEL